jgi:hypothetical protein
MYLPNACPVLAPDDEGDDEDEEGEQAHQDHKQLLPHPVQLAAHKWQVIHMQYVKKPPVPLHTFWITVLKGLSRQIIFTFEIDR